MAYLRRSTLFIALALSACDVRKTQPSSVPPIDPGWHYSWNGGIPHIGYGFSNTIGGFFGHCDSIPIFAMINVAHLDNAKTFTIELDGEEHQFDVDSGHGSSLLFFSNSNISNSHASNQFSADVGFAWMLAKTRHGILVSTDNGMQWIIPPTDLIARFVRDCIAFRSAKTPTYVKMNG